MPLIPSIVFSRIGQTQTKAMMNTFMLSPTPITTMPNGISAGGGIDRRNSTTGAVPRRNTREPPSAVPTPTPSATAIAYPSAMRRRLGHTSLPTRSNNQLSAKRSSTSGSGG
jgi:hypothetical protein